MMIALLLQMSEWGAVVERLGLPIGIIVVVAIFFYKGLWPLLSDGITRSQQAIVQDLKRSRKDRAKELARFMTAIEQRDKSSTETSEKITNAIRALTEEIKATRGGK